MEYANGKSTLHMDGKRDTHTEREKERDREKV